MNIENGREMIRLIKQLQEKGDNESAELAKEIYESLVNDSFDLTNDFAELIADEFFKSGLCFRIDIPDEVLNFNAEYFWVIDEYDDVIKILNREELDEYDLSNAKCLIRTLNLEFELIKPKVTFNLPS